MRVFLVCVCVSDFYKLFWNEIQVPHWTDGSRLVVHLRFPLDVELLTAIQLECLMSIGNEVVSTIMNIIVITLP